MVRSSWEEDVIQRFKERVTEALGDRLDKIILFGSRSRGDADEDSDFDFLVLVKDPG
ncbi:MAG: nucleotidyltransferase domain-containing protein, partial [Deltaproteobacteria bacterium]|nr:nucleotidyltransferase domain-containing protein [Deltaproteobacteria bacterium]